MSRNNKRSLCYDFNPQNGSIPPSDEEMASVMEPEKHFELSEIYKHLFYLNMSFGNEDSEEYPFYHKEAGIICLKSKYRKNDKLCDPFVNYAYEHGASFVDP